MASILRWPYTSDSWNSESLLYRVQMTDTGSIIMQILRRINGVQMTYCIKSNHELIRYCMTRSPKQYCVYSTVMINEFSRTTVLNALISPIRTLQGISSSLLHIERTIRTKLIPSLTGRLPPNDCERNLLALPARLGGVALANPTQARDTEFLASEGN